MIKKIKPILVAAWLLSVAVIPLVALGAEEESIVAIPLIQSEGEVFVVAEFAYTDLNVSTVGYEGALQLNQTFIDTAASGNFDEVKKLYSENDGSQQKFEGLRSAFSSANIYRDVVNVKYDFGVSWGPYKFILANYAVGGRTIQIREDIYCQKEAMCRKVIKDFGQPFEIGYLKLMEVLKKERREKLAHGVSSGLSTKQVYGVSPPGEEGKPGFNNYKLTIGIKKLESNICVDCEMKNNGVVKSERGVLNSFVEFVMGARGVDVLDDASLLSYVDKFSSNEESKSTAFPLTKWDRHGVRTVYANARGYMARIKAWAGGVPVGYIMSEEGVYLFVDLNKEDGDNPPDIEVLFSEKVESGEFVFNPKGNEGSLEQTLIRDAFFLRSLKELVIH